MTDVSSTLSAAPVDKPERLVAMDVLRGLVMTLMAFDLLGRLDWLTTAYPGNAFCQWIRFHAEHVSWQGCSLHDLIQPTFSFLVGTACVYSIASRRAKGRSTRSILGHAVWRALVLIALGVWMRSLGEPRVNWTFEDTLAQIGIGYVPLVCIALRFRLRGTLAIAIGLIAAYWLLFACWPLPDGATAFADHWNARRNPAQAFDRWFLPHFPGNENRFGNGYGVLNAIPTLGTMLLGLVAGHLFKGRSREGFKLSLLLAGIGIGMLALGWLMEATGVCPIIKKIWTASFALWSGGFAFLGLAIFHVFCDILKWRRAFFPLMVVGLNSIAAYVLVDAQWRCPFVKTALSPVVQPVCRAIEASLRESTGAAPTGRIIVVRAEYGAPDRRVDVTKAVAALLECQPRAPIRVTNEAMGCDPAPGADKVLTVDYTVDGKTLRGEAREDKTLRLDAPGPADSRSALFAERVPNFVSQAFTLLGIWLILFWMHRRKLYIRI